MKSAAIVVGLFLGTISAVHLQNLPAQSVAQSSWVELPNCGVSSAKQVPLADDLSNATIATCKVNAIVHKNSVKTGFIYDPVIRTSEVVQPHEHQVTHEREGKIGPAGPTRSVTTLAQKANAGKWVELPDCNGASGEVRLLPDVSNATAATCKFDPKGSYAKKLEAEAAAKAAAAKAKAEAEAAAAEKAAAEAAAAADANKPVTDAAAAHTAATAAKTSSEEAKTAADAAVTKATADAATADAALAAATKAEEEAKAASEKAVTDKAAADKAAADKKAADATAAAEAAKAAGAAADAAAAALKTADEALKAAQAAADKAKADKEAADAAVKK